MMKDVMCKLVIVGVLAVYGQTMYMLGKKNNQNNNTESGVSILNEK